MAIEQSRTSGPDMRSQAARGAAQTAGHSKPTGVQEGSSAPLGFAAVLAAADIAPESGLETEAVSSPCDAVTGGTRPEANASRTTPQVRQDAHAAVPADSQPAVESDAKTLLRGGRAEADTEAQTGAANVGLGSVAALLQGLFPLQPEGFPTVAQGVVEGAVAAEGGASQVAGVGRGFMKTSQLQQTLSLAMGKGTGHPAHAAASFDATVALGEGADSAGGTLSALAGMDLRPMAGGRSSAGGTGLGADMAPSAVGAMALVASQPDRAGREGRGQDDARGAGAAALEAWGAEATEVAETGGAGLGMEEQPVQETVRYWVGADSKQQAELTVQDVGGGAVDVTIQMQGKEAQVSFRADGQQARDALQSASGHLEQLLGKEGLTLSGLSVGTSSAGQDERRDQRQGGGKTAKVAGAAPLAQSDSSAASVARDLSGRGKALDLFV